jgi:hypothetical protein
MIAPGTKIEFEYAEDKFVPGWVVEYEAGRPQGDHRIAGFSNSDQKEAGEGDVWNVWSVVGSKRGSFKVKG